MKRILFLALIILLGFEVSYTEDLPLYFSIEHQTRRNFIEVHANEGKLRELDTFAVSSSQRHPLRFRVNYSNIASLMWIQERSIEDIVEQKGTAERTHSFGLQGDFFWKRFYFRFKSIRSERHRIERVDNGSFETREFRSDINVENSFFAFEYIRQPDNFQGGFVKSPVAPRPGYGGSLLVGGRWERLYLRAAEGTLFSAVTPDAFGSDQNLDRFHGQTYSLFAGYGWTGNIWKQLYLNAALRIGVTKSVADYELNGVDLTADTFNRLIIGEASAVYYLGKFHAGFHIDSGTPHFESSTILFQGNDYRALFFLGAGGF